MGLRTCDSETPSLRATCGVPMPVLVGTGPNKNKMPKGIEGGQLTNLLHRILCARFALPFGTRGAAIAQLLL